MEVGVGEVHAWGCVIWRKGVSHQLYWQVQRLLERIALGNLGVCLFLGVFPGVLYRKPALDPSRMGRHIDVVLVIYSDMR